MPSMASKVRVLPFKPTDGFNILRTRDSSELVSAMAGASRDGEYWLEKSHNTLA